MARRTAISLVAAVIVTGIWLTPAGAPVTSATGGGPVIVLGAASGVDLPVNAATVSPDAYKGFQIHVSALSSAGVTLSAIAGSPAGGTLTGNLFCTSQVPAPGEVNYGCVALDGQSTTAVGLLATMTLQATGDGCVRVRLIDLVSTDPNAAVSDTFTVDQNTNNSQQNAVAPGHVDIVVGAGSALSCVGLTSVGGALGDLDAPQGIVTSAERLSRVAFLGIAALSAAAAIGWTVRRRRAR